MSDEYTPIGIDMVGLAYYIEQRIAEGSFDEKWSIWLRYVIRDQIKPIAEAEGLKRILEVLR